MKKLRTSSLSKNDLVLIKRESELSDCLVALFVYDDIAIFHLLYFKFLNQSCIGYLVASS